MGKVPYIPSSYTAVRNALELAKVGRGDVLYDLGAGDGRVVIEAARRGALAVAVEIDPSFSALISLKAREAGLDDRIIVLEEDFFNTYLGFATVIYQYLYPSISRKLALKYSKELRKGTRIIAYNLPIPGWIPVKIYRFIDENGAVSTHYLYIKGISDPSSWILKHETIPPINTEYVMNIARD